MKVGKRPIPDFCPIVFHSQSYTWLPFNPTVGGYVTTSSRKKLLLLFLIVWSELFFTSVDFRAHYPHIWCAACMPLAFSMVGMDSTQVSFSKKANRIGITYPLQGTVAVLWSLWSPEQFVSSDAERNICESEDQWTPDNVWFHGCPQYPAGL